MKHSSLLIPPCLLLLLLGCGNAIEDALPTGRALSRLQERCPWMGTQQMEDAIVILRLVQDEGVSQIEAFLAYKGNCEDDALAAVDEFDFSPWDVTVAIEWCTSCSLAITEHVYD